MRRTRGQASGKEMLGALGGRSGEKERRSTEGTRLFLAVLLPPCITDG